MQFARTHDLDLAHRILTHPKVYSLMGDDSLPPRELFEVNRHPAIQYVTVEARERGILGMFTLCPENSVCWQLHVAMLPHAKPAEKWSAARGLVEWLENTECRRLTAAVPQFNRPAVMYGIQGLGMQYVGRHRKAFAKFGELHDLVLLGRSIGGVPSQV